jgi:glycosyltransferase involved in cell wall biosynthesis
MERPDVTVILNAHQEGLLAQPTLASLSQALDHAAGSGVQSEVIAVLDRPDAVTVEVFSSFVQSRNDANLLVVDNGDPGMSRNDGVLAGRAEWIALLDADDLWGANWLSAAYHAATAEPRLVVWHPEISLYFGEDEHVFLHVDMEDPNYDPMGLAIANYWTALCFAPRPLLLEEPHPSTNLKRQIGYEDWSWNMTVIARGALHKVVPGTGHAIRRKKSSNLRRSNAIGCVPPPSEMFRVMLARVEQV